MRKSLITTAVLSALFAPALVLADDAPAGPSLSYNIGVYSQYIFRGMTQTDGKPAVQGGVDLTLPNGFYAGLWASNISWLRDVYNDSSDAPGYKATYYKTGGHMELDIYGGYRYSFANGLGIDVGALRYQYPGKLRNNTWAKANTTEVYGALNYGWLQGKVSTVVSPQAWGWGKSNNDGNETALGTYYAELNATIPVGDLIKGTPALAGVTGIAHIGRQDFAGSPNEYASYTDYKLGLQKSFTGEGFINGVNVGGYWTYANGGDKAWKYNGDNLGDNTGTVYVQKTF